MTINTHASLNQARKIINNWDFSYVVTRSVEKGMSPDRAAQALSELKEFLFQCRALSDTDLSPQSEACDELWHEFIVSDTRAYFHFCEAVYGEYLHHDGVTLTGDRLDATRQNSESVFGNAWNAAYDRAVACGRINAF